MRIKLRNKAEKEPIKKEPINIKKKEPTALIISEPIFSCSDSPSPLIVLYMTIVIASLKMLSPNTI